MVTRRRIWLVVEIVLQDPDHGGEFAVDRDARSRTVTKKKIQK